MDTLQLADTAAQQASNFCRAHPLLVHKKTKKIIAHYRYVYKTKNLSFYIWNNVLFLHFALKLSIQTVKPSSS